MAKKKITAEEGLKTTLQVSVDEIIQIIDDNRDDVPPELHQAILELRAQIDSLTPVAWRRDADGDGNTSIYEEDSNALDDGAWEPLYGLESVE